MIARRYIIPDKSYAHVFFRCHNRQFFLKPPEVKEFLIYLWAKYNKKYGIKIYEAIVLDNHAHFLIESPNSEALGNFMRVVNSQLARFINKYFKRDSQALRERFKSPLITTIRYFKQVMAYIWLNRFKVDRLNPITDKYCSACWRCYPQILLNMSDSSEEKALLENLLDHQEAVHPTQPKAMRRVIREIIAQWTGNVETLSSSVNMSTHTIGDQQTLSYRGQLFQTLKKETIPWSPDNLNFSGP